MELDAELADLATTHGRYLTALETAGFTRAEAFALVRDHHAALAWFALVSPEQAPPWLVSPHESKPSSATTERALRILRPRTPEQ